MFRRRIILDGLVVMAVAAILMRWNVSLSWIFLFIPAWVAFRLYWFWRRARGQGLLDD